MTQEKLLTTEIFSNASKRNSVKSFGGVKAITAMNMSKMVLDKQAFEKSSLLQSLESIFKTVTLKNKTLSQESKDYYRVTFSGQQIRSENIRIAPFKFVQLLEMTINHLQGDHAIAKFKGIVSEEEGKRVLQLAETKVPIKISKRDETGKEFSFYKGIALNLDVSKEGGVYTLSGKVASYSYLMDIKRKSRSFQVPSQKFESLLAQVVNDYSDGAFIDTLSNDRPVGQFLTQYNETDWQFIKRLASHFHSQPIAIDQSTSPRFYFGLPNTSSVGELISHNFEVKKDLVDYHHVKENNQIDVMPQDFIQYQAESSQLFLLGDKVKFIDKEWLIVGLKRAIIKGELLNTYTLSSPKGNRCDKYYNDELVGSSIIGTVKKVTEDKVLLALDIDKGQDNAFYWFSYSTNYTSDDNVGWYMMPEVGEKARLYYPTKDEKDAVATSTVRTEADLDGTLDPAIKTLRNKFGKTITLEPNKITIVGNGVEIILNDSDGINITSNRNVSVTAEGALNLKGRNVVMDAGDSVTLNSHGNTVTVNDKIILNGSEIKMN
ncbi:hypothetical protein RyT2_20710 [Pseudolactococcus yaeyamensis]